MKAFSDLNAHPKRRYWVSYQPSKSQYKKVDFNSYWSALRFWWSLAEPMTRAERKRQPMITNARLEIER